MFRCSSTAVRCSSRAALLTLAGLIAATAVALPVLAADATKTADTAAKPDKSKPKGSKPKESKPKKEAAPQAPVPDLPPPEIKPPATEMNGLPLVLHEDFSAGEAAMQKFDVLDPADWKMLQKPGGRRVMAIVQRPSDKTAKTEVRSPFGRAIVKDLVVNEFVMDVVLRSTSPEYNHQDLCLFFGVQDTSRLYYAHLGRVPDPNAGNLFLVNLAPRKNLLPPMKQGINWTPGYHTARITRDAEGNTEVFFDGQSWLKAKDTTFGAGQIGVGSFDDVGEFAAITVWGRKTTPNNGRKL